MLKGAVSGYGPPLRTMPSRMLVPKLYDDTRKRVRLELQEHLRLAWCLSFRSDMWMSRANENYISLTCHFLDSQFNLMQYNLSTYRFLGKHTAARIAPALDKLFMDGDIPQDICPLYVVTDNACTIRAATSELLRCERTCFAHTLQLVFGDAKQMTPGAKRQEALLGTISIVQKHKGGLSATGRK